MICVYIIDVGNKEWSWVRSFDTGTFLKNVYLDARIWNGGIINRIDREQKADRQPLAYE